MRLNLVSSKTSGSETLRRDISSLKQRKLVIISYKKDIFYSNSYENVYSHTGKCIRRFGGINAYCRYFIMFIDRKW